MYIFLCVTIILQGCYSFLVDPPIEASLNFLAVGDWGGISFHPYTTPVQTSVAEQMAAVAGKSGVKFTLALGDNFYLYGVQSVDDPRFMETFENVYRDPALQTPWHVVAGNHDHYGNVSAQIAYSKRSHRWRFPNYYHMVSENTHEEHTIDIILIDTILLCGNVYALGQQPVGPADVLVAEKQWSWIEEKLNSSRARYLLVGGHYPIYSVSTHGPTDCLTKRLEPLLYRYNVTAYLAGHDHNLQHIVTRQSDRKLDHFVIGAGNFVDDSFPYINSVPKDALKFAYAKLLYLGGFAYFEAKHTALKMKFIDGTGVVRYEYIMSPRLLH